MATAEGSPARWRPARGRVALRGVLMLLVMLLSTTLTACANPPAIRSSPSPTPTTPAQVSAHDLLMPGLAAEVVAEMVAAADGRPVVRVVLDRTRVRLTYVDVGNRPRSLVWLAGVITPSDDGTDLVSTTSSFDPNRFNLSDVATLFTLAGMISQSTSRQELQINEYDHGQIYMTVTTNPESSTVFFDRTGILIPQLSLSKDTDIVKGMDEVLKDRAFVLELGISSTEQIWTDVLASPGVIERRIRPLYRPMYLSQRRETPGGAPFDVSQVDPAVLGRLIRTAPVLLDEPPDSPVNLVVHQPADEKEPLITIEVGGAQLETDLKGTPITEP